MSISKILFSVTLHLFPYVCINLYIFLHRLHTFVAFSFNVCYNLKENITRFSRYSFVLSVSNITRLALRILSLGKEGRGGGGVWLFCFFCVFC